MGATPSISVGRLRRAVREVCNLAPGHPKTEAIIADGIHEMLRVRVPEEDLRAAIEWNHAESYIRREEDTENEVTVFFITPHGQAKERLT